MIPSFFSQEVLHEFSLKRIKDQCHKRRDTAGSHWNADSLFVEKTSAPNINLLDKFALLSRMNVIDMEISVNSCRIKHLTDI